MFAVTEPAFLLRLDERITRPLASVFADDVPETSPDHLTVTVTFAAGRSRRSRMMTVAEVVVPLAALDVASVNVWTSTSRSGLVTTGGALTEMETVEEFVAPWLSVTVRRAV